MTNMQVIMSTTNFKHIYLDGLRGKDGWLENIKSVRSKYNIVKVGVDDDLKILLKRIIKTAESDYWNYDYRYNQVSRMLFCLSGK